MRLLILLAALAVGSPALSQNFSCRIGATPTCLGVGETVCSSRGMCVDQNSACFDRSQCNYEGFTCRSNVTECVENLDRLLGDHNSLVRDYNALLDDHQELMEEHNRNVQATRRLQRDLADVESCLTFARTVEEARLCAP